MMGLIILYAVLGLFLLAVLAIMVYICLNGVYTVFGDFIERAIKSKKARNWDRKED